MESTNNSIQQNSSLREGFHDYTLQDMPLEILDMILLKAILFPLRASTKSQPFPAVELMQEPIERFMTVWSEWYRRLNTRWFKIMLRRQSGMPKTLPWKIFSLDQQERVVAGFTKLRNKIYVLCCEPPSIYVYEDHGDFRPLNTISLQETIPHVCGIHSSEEADCLFILEAASRKDGSTKTVWKMDKNCNHATKWLEDQENEIRLSVAEDGNVMIMRQPRPKRDTLLHVRIEVYRPDATLVNSFYFPCSVFENCVKSIDKWRYKYRYIVNGVRTRLENFIISYHYVLATLPGLTDYATAVIHTDKIGKVLSVRLSPRFKGIHDDEEDVYMPMEEMTRFCYLYPSFIFLDEKSNRLFATDYRQNVLFVFDSNSLKLTDTIRLHLKHKKKALPKHQDRWFPTYFDPQNVREFPIYFDSQTRQLLVKNYDTNHVEVYRVV